jgi:23S rRNA pseudouridine1911/1915/1917 synthase
MAPEPSPWRDSPEVLDETEDFAVVYKPPFMHSAPLGQTQDNTLLEWYARIYPPVRGLRGKKAVEGGLVHRLDYETEGLILIAKNQAALDTLLLGQNEGTMVKEYSALTESGGALPGFSPPPFDQPPPGSFFIRSFFRPWGPGRKAVRPVMDVLSPGRKETAADRGRPYATEVLAWEQHEGGTASFSLRLIRGFRHQIRCHLSWIGMPVMRDTLYGASESIADPKPPLALRARFLSFCDPRSGAQREYSLPGWNAASG